MRPEQIRKYVIKRAEEVGMDKRVLDYMINRLLDTDERLMEMYKLMKEHDPDDPTLLLTCARMT